MSQRWQEAQQAEISWWGEKKKDVASSPEYRRYIKKRARRVENWLGKFIDIRGNSNILEIGGGATQLIDFFAKGNKYALDPLADMYQREFGKILSSKVNWSKGKNEALPYKDNFFDIVVSRNVLDHVDSVDKSLSEIRRVLKKDGIFYLGLNTFSGPLYLYKLIIKEKEHPFVFTPRKIKSCAQNVGFIIVDSIIDAPENMEHFKDVMASSNMFKSIIRGILLRLRNYHFNEFILKK